MADHLDRIGQQVGDYRLLRWLGGGGFGNVYLAEQVRDHSQVAVKLLQIRLTRSEELKAFINEARTIRLKHSHIVPLLDFGISREDIPFLVMEYAVQGTLRDRYPKSTQLPLTAVVSYVQQAASALLYAHEQHLIHRDVKPENMLLRADGTVLLSDFGIASVAHSSLSLSLHQGIGGTIPYMAPEQSQGQARAASDQYSLGVVVYEWIAGRRPFEGTAVEVAMQHAMKLPPSLAAQVPTLSRAVDQVVLKALAKDPRDRFVTVQDFAAALEQAARGMPHIFSSFMPNQTLPPAMPDVHRASSIGSSEQVVSPNPSISPAPSSPLVSPQATLRHPSAPSLHPAIPKIGSPGQSAPLMPPPANIESSSVAGKPPQPIHVPPPQKRPDSVISASPVQTPLAASVTLQGTQTAQPALSTRQPATTPAESVVPPSNAPRRISRRTVLGLGGAGLVVVGTGTALWWLTAGSGHNRLVSTPTPLQKGPARGTTLLTYSGHTMDVWAAAWSPDGKHIASGGDEATIHIWDPTSGKRVFTYAGHVSVGPIGQQRGITVIVWSPDSTRIASARIYSPTSDFSYFLPDVRVWEVSTGTLITTYTGHMPLISGHSNAVSDLSWSRDGKSIVSAGLYDKTAKIWDAATGRTLVTYRGHTGIVNETRWSPDGTRIASFGDDNIQVWDTKGQHLQTRTGLQELGWSPDSKRIASGGDSDELMHIWDPTTGKDIFTSATSSRLLNWSPDGKSIASERYTLSGSGNSKEAVDLHDAKTGAVIFTYHVTAMQQINAIPWSPDSTRVAVAGLSSPIYVWQAF
jgi:serine/threonine protein kinase/WD40 repeat protein